MVMVVAVMIYITADDDGEMVLRRHFFCQLYVHTQAYVTHPVSLSYAVVVDAEGDTAW